MRMKSGISMAAIVGIGVLSAHAAQEEARTVQKAPIGYVLVEEDVFYDLPENYPDQPMKSAERHAEKKEYKEAARDLRKVDGYLRAERSRSGERNDSALEASSSEVESMARTLEEGKPIANKDLKQAFARAHLALSHGSRIRAAERLAAKEGKKTGNELKAGAEHLEKAAEWSGAKLEQGAKATVRESKELSGKLIEGAKWVPEEVGKGIRDLGVEADRLGQKLGGRKPADGSASL